MESGAGSTMLKFGLLILLVNIFLKLALGFGLWNLALKHKNDMNNASPYNEEQIEAGNNYFSANFPTYKRPLTAVNVDSFGHTKGLVQILNDVGYKYYLCLRPSTDKDRLLKYKLSALYSG